MSVPAFIPFNRPEIDDAEIGEVINTLRSGWLTTGVRTAQFEGEFRNYTGASHALALNSATAGLHLALVALGVGPGDEVITTPLTFCATVNVILHVGATPVLADIGPDGNIDPASIRARITPRTRVLMPVHFAGAPCDMDAIWKIAKEHQLFVVEDAAHAAGTFYRGQHVGAASSASDAVAFSFYATKNMTTGEGGMVTTNREDLASRMKMLALHGISKDAWNRYGEGGSWYYEVLESGFKYNLTDIQSAIGIHQLRKLERFIEERARYAELYRRELGDVLELELPQDCVNARHAWHLYVIRLNLDRLTIDRSSFISELAARNIGTSVHFIPIPLHPFFKTWAHLPENECPRCLDLYPRLVSLPLYPSMIEEEVMYVAGAVREVLAKSRKNRPLSVTTARTTARASTHATANGAAAQAATDKRAVSVKEDSVQ
jgi:dTDP-4-amino-4,6-dideoxygalactose transaminase